MAALDELWPDPDRREAALERMLIRIHAGADVQKNTARDPGVALYIALTTWLRIKGRMPPPSNPT